MHRIAFFASSLALLASSCAMVELNDKGSKVVQTAVPVPQSCRNLGPVIGQGGGYGGFYIPNESLMKYALNDALNKAANLGATHLYTPQPPSLGGMGGSTTTATVMAYAYDCR